MKRILFIALLLSGSMAIGQAGKKQFKDLSAEQIATLQTKKMTLALDLSPKQQEQMQELHFEHAKLRKAKREAHKKDADKALTEDQRYQKRVTQLDERIAQKEKVKAILSDEQFTKWEALRPKGKRKGKSKGRGKK